MSGSDDDELRAQMEREVFAWRPRPGDGLDPEDGGVIDWPEPIDILADPGLTGKGTVDETWLPASILALARTEGARLQVDPAHVAALAIGVCSALVSDECSVTLKHADTAWVQQSRIWVAVVAESGRRKTDTFRAVLPGVEAVQRKLRRQYEEAKEAHRQLLEDWEKAPRNERDKKPKEPREERILTDDFTIEVLSDLLGASNKLLLKADELATFLGAFDRYKQGSTANAARAHALALYDGGSRRIDRVLKGNTFVENWSAVPVGHIQPARVRGMVGGLSEDGLLQRFMLIMPGANAAVDPEQDDVPPDRAVTAAFRSIQENLHELMPPETQGPDEKPVPMTVHAGPDCQPLRRHLFRLIERIEADSALPAALKEAASKWRGLLARLALLFHCVELVEVRLRGERPDPVDMTTLRPATVRKAVEFIRRIVVPSTFRFHNEVALERGVDWHVRWIAGHILAHRAERITAREIGRACRDLRGREKLIEWAMETLVHAGWCERADVRRDGLAWAINPRIYEVFAVRAAAEGARRAAARERLRTSIADLARETVPNVTRGARTNGTLHPVQKPDDPGLRLKTVPNVTRARETQTAVSSPSHYPSGPRNGVSDGLARASDVRDGSAPTVPEVLI